jgi:hypothetical protein
LKIVSTSILFQKFGLSWKRENYHTKHCCCCYTLCPFLSKREHTDLQWWPHHWKVFASQCHSYYTAQVLRSCLVPRRNVTDRQTWTGP